MGSYQIYGNSEVVKMWLELDPLNGATLRKHISSSIFIEVPKKTEETLKSKDDIYSAATNFP